MHLRYEEKPVVEDLVAQGQQGSSEQEIPLVLKIQGLIVRLRSEDLSQFKRLRLKTEEALS